MSRASADLVRLIFTLPSVDSCAVSISGSGGRPSQDLGRGGQVLMVLVVYRLLSPGSEWRLHRHWFERSALGDLLGADAALADIHTLYACHDRLLEHKEAVFDHLVSRWRDLFNVSFDVLLYDLTSTYFESDPPADDEDKRRRPIFACMSLTLGPWVSRFSAGVRNTPSAPSSNWVFHCTI
jgi:hypothetical protein